MRSDPEVRVHVKLFARLRDIIGAAEVERDVPAGATVRQVWDALADEYPDLAGYRTSISTAVNAEYSRLDTVVRDGDEIAFLPPVSGGSQPVSRPSCEQRSPGPGAVDDV